MKFSENFDIAFHDMRIMELRHRDEKAAAIKFLAENIRMDSVDEAILGGPSPIPGAMLLRDCASAVGFNFGLADSRDIVEFIRRKK